MSNNSLRLAVILGSVRDGRFGHTVANWFVGEAEARDDIRIDLVDLTEVPIGSAAPTMTPPPQALAALGAVTPRLDAADAFVVVTPEYNHSYPAALKNIIDWHEEPLPRFLDDAAGRRTDHRGRGVLPRGPEAVCSQCGRTRPCQRALLCYDRL